MARRRKQSSDSRQLSLFDAMANHIEQIREENIQDDLREDNTSAPVSQAEAVSPFTHTLDREAQNARQTKLSVGNSRQGTQAGNHQRRSQWGLHQLGLFDTGWALNSPEELKRLEAMGSFDFDLKVYGQQQTEARALSSETARLAGLQGMSDWEILESMGINTSLKITE